MGGHTASGIMARTLSFGVSGVNGYPVHVEVFSISGIPAMEIIGLPDTSVRESKDRVNAAIINSGKNLLPFRYTVNLAPADMKKEGPSFDLPIAVGIMLSIGEIVLNPLVDLDEIAFFGELGLDGCVQPINGALPMVISAKENGITKVILPEKNAQEVSCIQGMTILPVSHLKQVIGFLEGTCSIEEQKQVDFETLKDHAAAGTDMALIKGQKGARRAIEVAAAGGHNMLMIGVPGSGKTMLARCIPGILPPMSFEEALETTRIHSIAGKLPPGSGLMVTRPFCAPHHNASVASLIGGGQDAKPGEVSLSHNGVLFLDELPEFSRSALEALRQPLEDGVVSVARVKRQAQYQSSFMLVAAMNPCPCGYYGDGTSRCTCSENKIKRYLNRVSGPLLDRFDIQIEVPAVKFKELRDNAGCEMSEDIKKRVEAAREIQRKRYSGTNTPGNAKVTEEQFEKYCVIDKEAEQTLKTAFETLGFTARAYNRVLKVARTIADLDGEEIINSSHVLEAIQYRSLDKKYWK